jgi:hypothetical protein
MPASRRQQEDGGHLAVPMRRESTVTQGMRSDAAVEDESIDRAAGLGLELAVNSAARGLVG